MKPRRPFCLNVTEASCLRRVAKPRRRVHCMRTCRESRENRENRGTRIIVIIRVPRFSRLSRLSRDRCPDVAPASGNAKLQLGSLQEHGAMRSEHRAMHGRRNESSRRKNARREEPFHPLTAPCCAFYEWLDARRIAHCRCCEPSWSLAFPGAGARCEAFISHAIAIFRVARFFRICTAERQIRLARPQKKCLVTHSFP